MKILFAASEGYPFCKTGGLADVVGSLPVALAQQGEEVSVILPLYGQIASLWRDKMVYRGYCYVDLSWRHEYCGLFSLRYRGVTWYFADNERYFHRPGLYGEFDDGERFAFFSRAVVSLLPLLEERPEVIHCHDWQTALVPVYLKNDAAGGKPVQGIRTVFTIHNVEYQGRFAPDTVEDLLGLPMGWYDGGTLRMDDGVNLMKGAVLTADAVTTVSPTYARQLREEAYAHGMAPVLALVGSKVSGVLNGIDMESYNPATDKMLPRCYSPADMTGKGICKRDLQVSLGLREEADTPLVALVSRLVGHKGMDLVCQRFDELMKQGVQVVVLGRGESYYEDFFRAQMSRYPGRAAAQITYSESLARRVYGGCDIFLMPSKSEPCGLSQMIAMRYGAVPVVRRTGGLADSVKSCQVGQWDGTGYLFENYDAGEMVNVVSQAVGLYHGDRAGFAAVQKRGMEADFSWTRSAADYRAIYTGIL